MKNSIVVQLFDNFTHKPQPQDEQKQNTPSLDQANNEATYAQTKYITPCSNKQ